MVKTSNYTPDHAVVCQETINEWNNIKKKSIDDIDKLFKKFNLDFLSIRIYALSQSKYNPVERNIVTLSGKLVGITLPIDHFDTYLNIQGKVIDPELVA
ncbi:11594_t:CDS:2 [Funneliformis geosporum]|uniref:11594_t:CDS:1 n=1 Tax=Funneliformis geosporum TaxID=1117311 RepID=A0A9W4SFB4_9GLOM|nr:11594_t:CDS:2 [Funneliformis geosporum]